MKLIKSGKAFRIFGDDLQTFNTLPSGTYRIQFAPMAGFYFEQVDDFTAIEEKIYGNHMEKIAKVLKSYQSVNRSLGAILSGDKGMGKSLFTQLLSSEVIKLGMPVIMVTQPWPGVADFIDSIDQECLVMFDEFEKVFNMDSDKGESQNDLLGLFDGTSQKKRLYVVTVNKLHQVSEYMVSRPGRFHYHIRFDYPSAGEIEVYLKDKLKSEYYSEIKHVIAFSNRVKLNYDSLRAIAFELNLGYSFNTAISDLNILTTDAQRYDIKIKFTNGKTVDIKGQKLNMFNETIRLDTHADGDWLSISFDTSKIKTDYTQMIVDGSDVELITDGDNDLYKKDVKVVSVSITHYQDAGVNYRLAI